MILYTVEKVSLDAEYITTEPVMTVSVGFHINIVSVKPFEILFKSGLAVTSKKVEVSESDPILKKIRE